MNAHSTPEDIGAYSLGALDASEEAALRDHLRGCKGCEDEFASYAPVRDALNAAVPQAPLPDGFTNRLLARVAGAPEEPRRVGRPALSRRSRLPWALAAACLILSLALGSWGWQLNGKLSKQRAYYADIAALMARPDVVELDLDPAGGAARGKVYLTPERDAACLVLGNLPPLPEGKVYQLWLNSPGGRDSGGTFAPLRDGAAWRYLHPARGLRGYVSLGITVEPEGGSPAPTTPRVIGGHL